MRSLLRTPQALGLLIGAILASCSARQQVIKEPVIVTRVVERVITATPVPIESTSTSRPPAGLAAGALQNLVGTLALRTGYRQVSNAGGAANLYFVYVDENVRDRLVAYHTAIEGRDGAYQKQTLADLEAKLRERNELPMLLFVQPAEGTKVILRDLKLSCPGVGSRSVVRPAYEPTPTLVPTPDNTCTGKKLSPVRLDAVLRGEMPADASGFAYFPYLVDDGTLTVDGQRNSTLAIYFMGGLGNGRTYLGPRNYADRVDCFSGDCSYFFAEDLGGKWPMFSDTLYMDLLPTDRPLDLLPDVVAKYIVGERPSAIPSSGLDITIQWDLSGRDILQIVDLLLKLLVMLGVGAQDSLR